MDKPAQAQYPIHDLLQKRWSPRAFSGRAVEADKLRILFEAARWAPSSFNEQPWSFIVATKDDQANFDRLLRCLLEGNRAWARHAPVLRLSVAKLRFEEDGEPNRHAFHDVGLAVENLVIQATALGLVVHQMAGFDVQK
ncbi:MAG: nitroreductase family protein, partial [Nitrospiraceae bacterium]